MEQRCISKEEFLLSKDKSGYSYFYRRMHLSNTIIDYISSNL